MTRPSTVPLVAVLLCTFQGGRFLEAQLDTVHSQTHGHWRVWASDDHSTDTTIAILEGFQARWGAERLDIRRGPAAGFRANFMSLACDPAINADYFAYCDQDDLWDTDKLARALAWLQAQPEGLPALYCGRTRLIDEQGNPAGLSPLFSRPPSFANALVQSIAGGNTMVFNEAARRLLLEAGGDVSVQTHDWWTYIVVSGCGGSVFYDRQPAVSYRQHGGNEVGSNAGWPARWSRARRLLGGEFRDMNGRNLAALDRLGHRLTASSLRIRDEFATARDASLPARLFGVRRSGIYLQTTFGNLGLAVAAMLKKL